MVKNAQCWGVQVQRSVWRPKRMSGKHARKESVSTEQEWNENFVNLLDRHTVHLMDTGNQFDRSTLRQNTLRQTLRHIFPNL